MWGWGAGAGSGSDQGGLEMQKEEGLQWAEPGVWCRLEE